MTLGKYIRTLREAEGLSREKLARRADIATHTLWRIETDVSRPQLETLEKIAAALQVTPMELLAGEAA
jgi:transcriptional regulator with XRE-family HTH domain